MCNNPYRHGWLPLLGLHNRALIDNLYGACRLFDYPPPAGRLGSSARRDSSPPFALPFTAVVAPVVFRVSRAFRLFHWHSWHRFTSRDLREERSRKLGKLRSTFWKLERITFAEALRTRGRDAFSAWLKSSRVKRDIVSIKYLTRASRIGGLLRKQNIRLRVHR